MDQIPEEIENRGRLAIVQQHQRAFKYPAQRLSLFGLLRVPGGGSPTRGYGQCIRTHVENKPFTILWGGAPTRGGRGTHVPLTRAGPNSLAGKCVN